MGLKKPTNLTELGYREKKNLPLGLIDRPNFKLTSGPNQFLPPPSYFANFHFKVGFWVRLAGTVLRKKIRFRSYHCGAAKTILVSMRIWV